MVHLKLPRYADDDPAVYTIVNPIQLVVERIVLCVGEPGAHVSTKSDNFLDSFGCRITLNIGSESENLHGGRARPQFIVVLRSRTWS